MCRLPPPAMRFSASPIEKSRRPELIFQWRQSADTVEKLQIFPDGKFIYTLTISKF